MQHSIALYELAAPVGLIDLSAQPMPPLGGKAQVIERKGLFLLERGPGTLRTWACTNAGSGTFQIIDGLPDENGMIDLSNVEDLNWFGNGRQLYKANPAVMNSWMLDAGFNFGLMVRHFGGQVGAPAMGTVVWVPFRTRQARPTP